MQFRHCYDFPKYLVQRDLTKVPEITLWLIDYSYVRVNCGFNYRIMTQVILRVSLDGALPIAYIALFDDAGGNKPIFRSIHSAIEYVCIYIYM